MKFKFPLCDFFPNTQHSERWKVRSKGKGDPPGRGHISKHGGSGDPHPEARHGGDHLKNERRKRESPCEDAAFHAYFTTRRLCACVILTGAAPFTQMITLFLLDGTFL